jgi:hypothetical protein
VQKAIDIMTEDELAQLITFYEQTKLLLVVLLATKTYQRIKIKNLDGALS